MAARILNISYDGSLLQTRQSLLQAEGHVVKSTLKFDEAMHACRTGSFDLVIVGHSIPEPEKQQFIRALRSACSTPILALRRHNEGPVFGADYDLDVSTGPAQLVSSINRVLAERLAA